jgi:hypothetical protein
MRLNADLRWKSLSNGPCLHGVVAAARCGVLVCVAACASMAWSQDSVQQQSVLRSADGLRSQRFMGGRGSAEGQSAATLIAAARQHHAAMVVAQSTASAASLSANWQALGPAQIVTANYGAVTGRVTSIAIDPADVTGNTVYLGTTGGGVWKSTNAAGTASAVSFVPLTDTLPVFSLNAGSTAMPSLSIGAVSVQNGIVLAGTGDPNDATDSYYGGGVLRSFDGGLTWTLIPGSMDGVSGNHSFLGLAVAGFAWSSTAPGLVVMAVTDAAEGELVGATDTTNSVRGLYYSTDAGVTWQMSVLMDGGQIVQKPLPTGSFEGGNAVTSVVWNPARRLFYAAVRYHGYYTSGDGATWSRMAHQPGTGMTTTACPTNYGTTGNPTCPMLRGTLAVQPVTGDTFALSVDSSNRDQGLWQDSCGLSGTTCGATDEFGTQWPSAALEVGGGSTVIPQADYTLALSAIVSGTGSSADTLLFVGTADLYRCSLAAGCSLRNTTNATNGCAAPAGVAGAQHALAVLATATLPLVYIGNDGGLWRSVDGVNQQATPCSADDASHFQNLNGGLGSLAEVISFAQHPTEAGTLLAGLGANGSAGTAAAGATSAWAQLSAGEGGTVAIDPAAPLNWTVSTAAGVSLRTCGIGPACRAADFTGPPAIGLPQVENDLSVIDPPWLLDPAVSSQVVLGTCRVWRGPGAGGSSWSGSNAISTLLAGPQNSACISGNPVLRSLAVGGPASGATARQDAGSTVLYAGMAGALDGGGTASGHLFATLAGGTAGASTAWTDLAGSPVTNGGGSFNPGRYDVSSVAVDTHDTSGKTVYATVMGFGVAHVYRSTDAGAHWLNVSSNLPDAPANAVLIDPNDANTLYVAMDTGLYVTSAVTSCTSTNCWSVYGVGLPNAPVVQLAAASGMSTGDGRTGELRAGTYGRGIWQIPLLTAASPAQPVMSLTPATLAFVAQQVGTASALQTITVTNAGTAPLVVASVAITGDFTQTNGCTAAPIAPGGTCAVQIVFAPTATGARTGLLTVYGNVAGGQATAALSGTATTPSTVVLTPLTLTFASTAVGATTAAQNVTISNTGGTTATLASETATGDFRTAASTCGATLGAGTGCTVAIVFTPTVSGARSGTLTVSDSVGTQTMSLHGTATSAATDALSPLSLTYGPQRIGTASAAQAVVLTNAGDVALTLIAASVSGDFSVVNACGNSLNAHASCSLTVAYVPTNVGNETGTLTVSDQFRSQTVSLSGVGLAPVGVSLAPAFGVGFAATGVGIISAGQTVTLTNNSAAPLTISGFALGSDFAVLSGSNTCGSVLAVSAACTLQVVFVPTVGGPRTGLLTVTDNAASSPQTLALTGTGVDFSLTASKNAATVSSGQSAVYGLLLTSASGVPGIATFTCSGAPAHAACLVVPGTVALGGGTATLTVTVATGQAAASLQPLRRLIWLALLLPVELGFWRPRRSGWSRLACVGVFCGLLVAGGCGSGRLIPSTGATTTPANLLTPTGTSTVVVSATSAGLVRTVDLSLTVQ